MRKSQTKKEMVTLEKIIIGKGGCPCPKQILIFRQEFLNSPPFKRQFFIYPTELARKYNIGRHLMNKYLRNFEELKLIKTLRTFVKDGNKPAFLFELKYSFAKKLTVVNSCQKSINPH